MTTGPTPEASTDTPTPDAAAVSAEAPADVPPFRYTAALADQIETTWQRRWHDEGTFHAPNPVRDLADGWDRVASRRHAYVMDMIPYPSGAGLHVCHPLGHIATDVHARYLSMRS